MNPTVKYPDMRPPVRGGPIRELPAPAQYRQTTPAAVGGPAAPPPRVERRRLLYWFGIAVLLHAALFIAIWLTPPLRLKWSPSPDAWVPVVSLPAPAETATVPAVAAKSTPSKIKGHRAPPPADPNTRKVIGVD
jgi:hypothetical protein